MIINDENQRDPQTYAIIGAAMEVHRELGPGFLEMVYQEALALELDRAGVPFHREKALPISYKGRALLCTYRADFICFDDILVELKAIDHIGKLERAQVINYLKATGVRRALILNFANPVLQWERLVR
jgi:GxxExxY protein